LPFRIDANTILFVGDSSVVACITDFGTSDYYAGALHGVLASLLPGTSIVDITHEIPAGDIRRAALMLWEAEPSFPEGTVFLSVVDPGVGSARLPAAFAFPRCRVVSPDNGTVTFLCERYPRYEAAALDPRRVAAGPVSQTFHGRDLFAPAAARLIRGEDPNRLGPALASPVRLPLPMFQGGESAGWDGEVLYIDRFGNAVTSIGCISKDGDSLDPWLATGARAGRIPASARVRLPDGMPIPLRRTYADASEGAGTIALTGSNGLLEIASWKKPAAGGALKPGDTVSLKTFE
jgi:S-adenosyl-L-methionine hydrolase (adenosine-forming)